MAKALLASVPLFLLLAVSSSVVAEELETLPPSYPHPHSPTQAPLHPPASAPHPHHHHHHHPPAPAPAPVHPPSPPTHHNYPPTPAPAKSPTHHHHHHPSAPVHPPLNPPVKPPVPVHPPLNPPVKPPVPVHPPLNPPAPVHPFPRSYVAVQGVVYVKSCKYAGVDTLLGATPLLGSLTSFN